MRFFLNFLFLFLITASSVNVMALELFKKEIKVKVSICLLSNVYDSKYVYTYKLENNKIYELVEVLDTDDKKYAGKISTLDNCTILDSKNWSCDGFNGVSVVKGKFVSYEKNVGKCPMKREQLN